MYQSPRQQKESQATRHHSSGRRRQYFRDHYIDVACQSKPERKGRGGDQNIADAVHVLGVLASVDDPVIGGRSHQQHDRERNQE